MGGQNAGKTNYVTHVVVFVALTALMYVFAFTLVGHNENVPERVDTVHAGKQG